MRRLPLLVVAILLVAAAPAPAEPSAARTAPAVERAEPAVERELAERHAPIVRLQLQEVPCGHGEPYQPTDVDGVLGSQEVVLRGPWDDVNVVAVAPAGTELDAGRIGYHLDFPGNPLAPGCDYERWSKRIAASTVPTVYAHVAADPSAPGKISLQYWFFYAFNDYNNKHEGDWEMVELVFDAADAAAALGRDPTRVGYSQHESAEQALWGDAKLERIGPRPVVYPAAGSHANYFESALYLGTSAAEGVGCDDTTGPSRTLEPRIALVPSAPEAALQAYPWLAFPGHWGERQPAFYNGPTGPNAKRQWNAPIAWADESWRDRSYAIVGGSLLGPGATGFFCDAVAGGSDLLRQATIRPGPVALALAAAVAGVAWLAMQTAWRPGAPLRLARRREVGQMLAAAARLYAAHPALFVQIGLVFVPLALVASLLEVGVERLTGLAARVATTGEASTLALSAVVGLGLLFGLVAIAFVQAACARAMVDLDAGRPTSARAAYATVLRSAPRLLGALVALALPVALLAATAVGLPLGLAWLVRTSLAGQVVELEAGSSHAAARRSAALTRGRAWRSAALLFAAALVPLLAGPLVGVALLLQGGLSLHAVNLVSSLVYAVAVPYAAIATTYLYFDLLVRERLEPIEAGGRARELPAEIADGS